MTTVAPASVPPTRSKRRVSSVCKTGTAALSIDVLQLSRILFMYQRSVAISVATSTVVYQCDDHLCVVCRDWR